MVRHRGGMGIIGCSSSGCVPCNIVYQRYSRYLVKAGGIDIARYVLFNGELGPVRDLVRNN